MFLGFSLLATCGAQSIVGKWKSVSVKNYYSAEYAKQVGKSMEEKTAKEAGNSEMIYNADHTFILNMSACFFGHLFTALQKAQDLRIRR